MTMRAKTLQPFIENLHSQVEQYNKFQKTELTLTIVVETKDFHVYQVSIPMFGTICRRVYTRMYYCTGALHLVEFVMLVLYIILDHTSIPVTPMKNLRK